MGNVLLSLNQEDEIFLRDLARRKYGEKKGSMSAVISEALKKLKESDKKEIIKKQFFERLEKGANLGFKGHVYNKRSEIYDD